MSFSAEDPRPWKPAIISHHFYSFGLDFQIIFYFSIEIGFFVSESLSLGLLNPFGCPIPDIPYWSPSLDYFAPVLTGRDFLLPEYFSHPRPIVLAVFVTFHVLGWRQYFSQHTSPPLENAVKRIYCHPPLNCRVARDNVEQISRC